MTSEFNNSPHMYHVLCIIQRLQNRALKICLKVEHRHPTDDLHRQTRVNTLYDRRKAHLKIAAFSEIGKPGRVQVTEKATRGCDVPRLIINRAKKNHMKGAPST